MSTSNERGRGRALPALRVSSSYSNSVAHAPQHNGDNYGAPTVNININPVDRMNSVHHRLGLDSSVPPLNTTGDVENPPVIPHSLPEARIQIQAIGNPQLTTPINSAFSPGASSLRSSKGKHRLRGRFHFIPLHFILFLFILAIILASICAATMHIFTARESSSGQTPKIQHGFFNSWIDYKYPAIWQRRVTLSVAQTELITGLAIVILAISIPSAYLILVRMIAKLCACLVHAFRSGTKVPSSSLSDRTAILLENQDAEANEHASLLFHDREEGLWSQTYHIWARSISMQSSVMSFVALASSQEKSQYQGFSWKHYRTYAGRFVLGVLFSLLAIAVFFILAFSTILSAGIVTDSTVLSNHPDCGVWVRDPKILSPSATGYDYLQEVEAADYSKNCYHGNLGADGCKSFLFQRIPYSNNSHRQCPFEDSLCLDGRFSAYTLKSGTASSRYAVSSKYLGINVKIGYSFKRITTCSPIQRRASLSDDQKTYEYEYGPSKEFGNLTWISPANPTWDFAGYNVATFFYKQNAISHNWQPSPEFKPLNHQAITLLLFQSQKNYHTTPQHDPIFPAEQSTPPSPGRPSLYFNNDPIATALACVDNTQLCDASGKACFEDIYHPSPELPDEDEGIGYYMLIQALVDSSIFQSIQLLGGRALVAATKLERSFSLPLAEEQWKIEVDNLFAASLVRPQITLRDYIRGTAAHDPEYADRTQGGMHGMCYAYKFPGRGWRNVSVWGMVLIVLLAFLILVLSIEVEVISVDVFQSVEVVGRHQRSFNILDEQRLQKDGQRILIAEWILDALFTPSTREAKIERHEPQSAQDEATGLEPSAAS